MENLITIKNEYNSLDKLHDFLKTVPSYECSKDYDIWEQNSEISLEVLQGSKAAECFS